MLKKVLEKCGFVLSEQQCDYLEKHLEFVLATNKTINLTRIIDRTDAERLHILDSLLVLPEVQSAPKGKLLDLGSGGGYPGVPLAIACGRDTVLLDSARKKMKAIGRFLNENPTDLAHITTLEKRAEELANERPEDYSAVVVRAVAILPSLVELAAPLLEKGGHLIALKGKDPEEEIEWSRKLEVITGMQFVGSREYTIPGGVEQRCTIVFRRLAKPPRVSLPRRTGFAQHKPFVPEKTDRIV